MGTRRIHERYRRSLAVKIAFIAALVVCALLLAVIGCGIGPMRFAIPDIIKALANGLFGCDFPVPDGAVAVITRIRLPRIVLA
ncbi:MAG: hypothetical protein JXA18_17015, partial [Chitinispirillaceae bacterium]|nr:hypothetical protein [Chitinispirillaceae bacterium]